MAARKDAERRGSGEIVPHTVGLEQMCWRTLIHELGSSLNLLGHIFRIDLEGLARPGAGPKSKGHDRFDCFALVSEQVQSSPEPVHQAPPTSQCQPHPVPVDFSELALPVTGRDPLGHY